MNKKKKFNILVIFLFLLIFIQLINADLGEFKVKNLKKEWNVVYSNDKDYFLWIGDKTKKDTQICLLSKTATGLIDLSSDKNIYDDKGSTMTQLSSVKKEVNKKDYYGYCYPVDNKEYLKFGEYSTVIEYQDINMLEYDLDFGQINFTLYKNILGDWNNTVNDIFVFYNEDSYKFGANDTSNENMEQYKYILSSDNLIYFNGLYTFYIVDLINKETHEFGFSDICLKENASCLINKTDDYEYEIIFYSDSNIDPMIVVKTLSSHSNYLASFNDKLAIAYQVGGNIYFKVYWLNGSVYTDEQTIATNLTVNARVKIKAVSNDSFIYAYLNTTNLYDYYGVYYTNGTLLFQQQNILAIAPEIDFDFMVDDEAYYYAMMEDSTQDFSIRKIWKNNLSISYLQFDSYARVEEIFYNEVSCEYINPTLATCFNSDDGNDQVTLYRFNPSSMTIIDVTDLDTVGDEGQIAMAQMSDKDVLGFVWNNNSKITFSIRGTNNSLIFSPIILDNDASNIGRVDIESTDNYFLVSWNDRIEGMIRMMVYNVSGSLIYNYTLADDESAVYLLYDTDTKDHYLNMGLPEEVYAFTYTNFTGYTLLNFYYVNGSEYESVIVLDIFNPVIDIFSPSNNSNYFDIQNVTFYANYSDDTNLLNSTLYVFNESDDLILSSDFFISGLENFTNYSYNFSIGNYSFYYKVFDTSNNFLISDEYLFKVISEVNISEKVSSVLAVTQYPYVDVNISYPLKVYYEFEDNYIQLDNAYLNLTINGSVTQYNLTWNSTTESFDISLLFTEIDDYDFLIYGEDDVYLNIENITGTFLVKEAYYITFNFFDSKDNSTWWDSNKYINNLAYLTAEFTGERTMFNNHYDSNLEPFISQISDSRFKKPVFHTSYIDGSGTLKLYEYGEYAIRLIDGEISFSGIYAIPNITDSYGINVYVGKYSFTNSTSYNILLTKKDLNPFRWLANWIFIILFGMIIVVSGFLFFMTSDKPFFAIAFGLGFTLMLIFLRVAIFIWKGF